MVPPVEWFTQGMYATARVWVQNVAREEKNILVEWLERMFFGVT
jgi:hypothetical protein